MKSYKLSDNLYLNEVPVPWNTSSASDAVVNPKGTNYIFVIDCSGSMAHVLDKLRTMLKQKLYASLWTQDTLSLIWFSGPSQCGVIVAGATVQSLQDHVKFGTLLDRWLAPVGMTGFKDPLTSVLEVSTSINNKNNNVLFFMTDGHDNTYSRSEILTAVSKLKDTLSASVFVEYGPWADRAMLTAMADTIGGVHIRCAQFKDYEVRVENILQQRFTARTNTVRLYDTEVAPTIDFAYTWHLENKSVVLATYNVDSKPDLTVDDSGASVYYFSSVPGSSTVETIEFQRDCSTHPITDAVYAGISIYASRRNGDMVWSLLKCVGDVDFIEQWSSSFSKHEIGNFCDRVEATLVDPSLRYVKGFSTALVPRDDAYTILDLLRALMSHEDVRVLLDSHAFSYTRISQSKEVVGLPAAQRKQLEELRKKRPRLRNKERIAECEAAIRDLEAHTALPFELVRKPYGYPINSLVFNEVSPNISILVERDGTVDLEGRIDDPRVPKKFPTLIYRNYAVIAHGLKNVRALPVTLPEELIAYFKELKVPMIVETDHKVLILLNQMPMINRQMVKGVSAIDTAKIAYSLLEARCKQKVLKDYASAYSDKQDTFKALYGDANAAALQALGLTERGFAPPTKPVESTDYIMGKALHVQLAGCSTLPPVKRVREKIAEGRTLNIPESLMAAAINDVEAFLQHNPKKLHRDFVVGWTQANQAVVRALSHQLSQVVFTIIIGQTWFNDLPPDVTTLTLSLHGRDIECTFDLRDEKIDL